MKKNEIDAAMAYNDYATNNNTGHYLNNIQQELMKAVIVIGFLLLGAVGWSQTVPYEMGATKHDSLAIGGKWLTFVSQDSTLAGVDSNAVVTEYAVKKYIDNNVNTLSGVAAVSDSVKALYDTADAHILKFGVLQDSIDVHTDTLQSIRSDLKSFSGASAVYFVEIFDTIYNYDTRITTNLTGLGVFQDSLDVHTDSLQSYSVRLQALESGAAGGTGDVKVSGTTVANTVAYWSGTDSTLVSDDVVKLYADSAVFTDPVIMHDSTYLMGQGIDLSDVWWGGTSNGAMDTGHVENAWYGLIHALDNPMTYLNDTKEVEGHLELKVWYIDDKTGEPAFQYGIKGLSPTEVATAFQINHEFMTRYVAEHEARLQKLEQVKKQGANLGLDVKFLIELLIFVALMGLIVGFRR